MNKIRLSSQDYTDIYITFASHPDFSQNYFLFFPNLVEDDYM